MQKKINILHLLYLIIVLLIYSQTLVAQGEENVWVFGNQAGLDFNTNPPTPIVTAMSQSSEAYASVCDKDGNLLFYTEGTRVWDRNHSLMPGGDNLNGLTIPANGTTLVATGSSVQGAIIVPIPENPMRYYVFSLTHRTIAERGRLYYSIVDMSLNGGLGAVELNNKGILIDSVFSEKMTAVVGDRCNIWLLLTTRSTWELYAYEVTSSGININPVISPIDSGAASPDGYGHIRVAPDRKKLVIIEHAEGCFLYDFDPLSGRLSNEMMLSRRGRSFYGAAFSPDSKKLYTTEGYDVGQYDISSNNLTTTISSYTIIGRTRNYGQRMRLAPDGKIYIIGRNGIYLDVINNPDLAGTAADYQADVITSQLPGTYRSEFPNVVPVIRKDTILSSKHIEVCDNDTPVYIIAEDTTGWCYVWNDGVTETSRPINQSGTYWISYRTPPCTWHTDTFEVNLLPASYHELTREICTGNTYDFNGTTLNTSGRYYDTLTAANGCDSVVILDLNVLWLPEPDIKIKQEGTLCLGDTAIVEATGADRYQWYVRNRSLGEANPQYIPLSNADNEILLVGMDNKGCTDTATMTIRTEACCAVFIPNAFSPNDDVDNDEFAAIPQGNLRAYRMEIYNRWGSMIFASYNISNRWDGTYKGTPADAGVYFYHFSGECVEGTSIVRKGDVILVR